MIPPAGIIVLRSGAGCSRHAGAMVFHTELDVPVAEHVVGAVLSVLIHAVHAAVTKLHLLEHDRGQAAGLDRRLNHCLSSVLLGQNDFGWLKLRPLDSDGDAEIVTA